MDPNTGRLYSPDEVRKLTAEEKAELIEIPEHEVNAVSRMNRKQRRAWAANKRKEMKEQNHGTK